MSPCRHGFFWNACKRQSGVGSECSCFVATATWCASKFHCFNWAALLGFLGSANAIMLACPSCSLLSERHTARVRWTAPLPSSWEH